MLAFSIFILEDKNELVREGNVVTKLAGFGKEDASSHQSMLGYL